MSQVLNKTAPPATPVDGTLAGLYLYLLLVFGPIGLKLAGLTRVAAWSWWKVTALLWLPWGMLAVFSLLGWLLHRRRSPQQPAPLDE
jgi:hypothetical protein